MHQPFSGWAKTLLEKQDYPDLRRFPGGPPKRPYDVTAQTLPDADGRRRGHREGFFPATLKPATQFAFESGSRRARRALWRRAMCIRGRRSRRSGNRGSRFIAITATGDFYSSAGERPEEVASSAHRHVSKLQRRAWMKAGRAGCSTISDSRPPVCTMPICKSGNLAREVRHDRDSGSGRAADRPGPSRRNHAARILRRHRRQGRRRAEGIRRAGRHADPFQSRLRLRDAGAGRQGEERFARRRQQGFLFAGVAAECFSGSEKSARLRDAGGDHAVERTKSRPGMPSPTVRWSRAILRSACSHPAGCWAKNIWPAKPRCSMCRWARAT